MMKRFSAAAVALLSSSFVTAAIANEDAASTSASQGLRGLGTRQDSVPTIDLSAEGEELKQPVQITSNGDTVQAEIRFDAAEYVGPAFTTMMRVYNGDLPGPTLRVKPGGKLQLTLLNDLTGPVGVLNNNGYQHANQTNVHTHGPHISGEDPGDNVFLNVKEVKYPGYKEVVGRVVGPRQFHKYRYILDDNHMPGTDWYHPHLHGSSALQASTASGMLIIEDPDDYPLPDMIKEAPEVQMLIYNLDIGAGPGAPGAGNGGLARYSKEAGDRLSNWTEGEGFTITDSTFNGGDFPSNTDIFLPNFQYKPKVTMTENKWYRFRILLATHENALTMGFMDSSNCEMKLIAKDGIYIKEGGQYGPRDITAILLASGNRADVLIRCSANDEMKKLAGGLGENFDPVLHEDPDKPTIFSIVVEAANGNGNGNAKVQDIPTSYDLPTPCYQADLQGVTADIFTGLVYDARGEPMGISEAVPPPIANKKVWVDQFTPYPNQPYLQLGTVHEITLLAAGLHPHHQHVNPYQLIDVESVGNYTDMSDATKTWFKSGDWHDLFQWPLGFIRPPSSPPPILTQVTVRHAVNQFAGRMTFHCHRLNHEDLGMISFFQVQGQEGTLWDGAETASPGCLLPKLPGNVNKD